MAYFNYHAKVKKLIYEGHFMGYDIVDNYNGISPAMIIYFDNHIPMPIRVEHWQEYFDVFDDLKPTDN